MIAYNKKIAIAIIFLLLLLSGTVIVYKIKQSLVNTSSASIKVLFIGNSYTSVNDLPKTVSDIASSLGDHLGYDMAAPGSYTFQQHAQDQTTLGKIRSSSWDFVVLQEQSLMPALPDDQINKSVEPYALQLNQIIHNSDPLAKTVFYETWGRKNGDSNFCQTNPDFCDYASMQSRINSTYEKLAFDTSGELAPVGEAWSQTQKTHPEIELYQSDGSHPSLEGTYLSACVFYATLFKKNVVGASYLNIDSSHAKILQEIAQQTVSERLKMTVK